MKDPLALTLMLQVEPMESFVRLNATGGYVMNQEEEDDLQKIRELLQEKVDLFSRPKNEASSSYHHRQVAVKEVKKTTDDDNDEEKKNKKQMIEFFSDDHHQVAVKEEAKKAKKPMKKRQRSPTDDDLEEEEKKKKKQKIELFSDDHEEVSVVNDAKTTKKPATNKCREDDQEYKEEQKTVKKKKKKTNVISSEAISNEITDRLKEFITGEMKGSELNLVIEKLLYATDLKKDQNRLSMPINQLKTDEFLREDEKRFLDRDTIGFDVQLLGPTLQLHKKPMKLAKWSLKTTSNYILKTNWNQFVEENNKYLTVNTKVQVWSYRREDQQLCFAIACVERADDQ